MTLREAYAELNEIDEALRCGGLGLDESMQKYERATALLRFIESKLRTERQHFEMVSLSSADGDRCGASGRRLPGQA